MVMSVQCCPRQGMNVAKGFDVMSHSTLTMSVIAAAVAVSLTGCGSKSAPTPSLPIPASGAATTSSAAPAASAKTCPAGQASGVIGGVSKCLSAGQECQAAHASDYPRYGFDCTQTNGRYLLKSRSSTGGKSSPPSKSSPPTSRR
jgi:hypothetical protein